ncbi:DUF6671 family protein [Microbacterium sp. SCN 69-37]|uniref:DUF6671 family protein n=1 Tax=Microbacterium sp. SCN 69-37 TaxID=1660115 RepID=UPI00086D4C7A|nr:DUF6671 family protein [Microbacterium sp. SCN 69-37]ODT25699.1 MAG: hypothetical protein ABS64_01095 [Microbacterium sp. SCN 69-37]
MTPNPYRGTTIVFATMHGKDALARSAFRTVLDATVITPAGIDTDQFGTFAGDIPRTLSPLDAARAKARLGVAATGVPTSLASEGSFTTELGWTTRQTEHLLFLDQDRGIEVTESHSTTFPVAPGRHITTTAQALSHATTIGFPEQGLIIHSRDGARIITHKNLRTRDDLTLAIDHLLSENLAVSVMPDYRAHRSPARAAVIATLCARMAQRLGTPCPGCRAPGYGRVKVIPGLPCGLCGTPTHIPTADLHACTTCDTTHTHPRTPTTADPQWCDTCNP